MATPGLFADHGTARGIGLTNDPHYIMRSGRGELQRCWVDGLAYISHSITSWIHKRWKINEFLTVKIR